MRKPYYYQKREQLVTREVSNCREYDVICESKMRLYLMCCILIQTACMTSQVR